MGKRVTGVRGKLGSGRVTAPTQPPAFTPANKQETGRKSSSSRINRVTK